MIRTERATSSLEHTRPAGNPGGFFVLLATEVGFPIARE